MKKFFALSFVFLFFISAVPLPAHAQDAEPGPGAKAFAKLMGRPQLADFILHIASATKVIKDVSKAKGVAPVKAILVDEGKKALVKYGDSWETNLAYAYTGLLTDDEMKQLAASNPPKATVDKLRGVQNDAGRKMKERSEALLKTILVEVVKNTYDRAAKLPAAAAPKKKAPPKK
jgi:hypothetical protein